jgi:ferredoxin-nitrite reductase
MCHDLLIFAETAVALGPRLAALRGTSPVVACPGAAWCTRGLADSRAAASRVRQAMPDGCGLLVGITGCPNNCAQAATADIGLVGRLQRVGEARVERFRLLAGGGKGETPVLASELHPAVPAEKVHEAVAWLVQAHQRAESNGPIPFADFVAASADGLRGELGRRYGAEHIA